MDFLNAVYAACVVFIGFYVLKVPMKYYVFVLLHLLLVFLTNDFLFPVSYMPDQLRYVESTVAIRDSLDFMNYEQYERSSKVAFSSLMFALSPMLSIKSVYSISIINFLLYAFLFIFLYKKKLLVGNAMLFYLLFPSFALYAAVSLRDMLILLFMILSIYALYRKQMLLSILIAAPLLYIKTQNFLIFIAAILMYKSIEKRNLKSKKTLIRVSFLLILLVAFGSMFSIDDINSIRRSMYAEDGGNREDYIPIAGYVDFLFTGFIGSFYMVLKPMIWEVRNPLQLVQSVENIVVFYMIYKIYEEQKIVKDRFITFLLIYFFVGMFIYGLVVYNFGTAARYRFTFEVVFIVFSLSILHKHRKSAKAVERGKA
ncbi:hypothetical protein [Sulfurovum sp.]|uniref:hypothetical protein n=1 Tax=Sulfurovum sp. TaxID=1969726 RepID=UPI0035659C73